MAISRQNSEILGHFDITENGDYFGQFRFGYFWRLTACLAVRLKLRSQPYLIHEMDILANLLKWPFYDVGSTVHAAALQCTTKVSESGANCKVGEQPSQIIGL